MSSKTVSLDAEQAVIGSILIDGRCFRDVATKLRESDFTLAYHQMLFRAAAQIEAAGKPIDPMLLADSVHGTEDEDKLRTYMAELMNVTPTAANALEYAKIVSDCARRRNIRQALQDGLLAMDDGEAEETVLPRIDAALRSANERSASELMSPMEQLDNFYRYREYIDNGGKPHVRTGFRTLDWMLAGGMVKKGLYFLAARPGMGKTAFALAIAEYVAKTVGRVDFFSMEMSSDQIMARRISGIARVDSKRIMGERLTEAEYAKVSAAAVEISQSPLYITDGESQTVERVSTIARASRDCKLVIIDHFRLFQIPGKQNPSQEYAQIAHALKRLAQAIDAPVLCLTQMNRANEQRSDKRPNLSDLRESGAAEEDADGVIFLHREDYYGNTGRERKPPEPITVEVKVAKNRHGETGHLDLSFWPETNTFRERFVR